MGGGDGGRPPMENERDVPPGKLRGFTPMDGNLQECPPFEKFSSQLSSFSQPINDLNLKLFKIQGVGATTHFWRAPRKSPAPPSWKFS